MGEHQINHCRFCGKAEIGEWSHSKKLVKYGTRHYAHHDCYLNADKALGALPGYEIRRFDDGALLRRGIADEKERLVRMMNLLGNG